MSEYYKLTIMKELSIEEKAKAYDKIMNRVKKELDACGSQDCDAARQIFRLFPELAESEDERIRKELLNAFQESEDSLYMVLTPHRRELFIAWLEKHSSSQTKE